MATVFQEFKEFALRGNVVDLAVGVVIGAAFGKIVSSLVSNVIMPPLGLITGGVDFKDKRLELKEAEIDAAGKMLKPAVNMEYGLFINSVIDFLIVALAIFAVVKLINIARRKPDPAPAAPPAPSRDQELLMEIRDALRAR
ncbi:MAG TPA: large-conductance mechanosensitive channel protein MscL [Tepidisphaeraceae bacterium]|jgi:large conductance mechanosensitive channel|nr:large-conductance mechanosensitive channel protein MscL [Tepidisphaeraceae bacterium]